MIKFPVNWFQISAYIASLWHCPKAIQSGPLAFQVSFAAGRVLKKSLYRYDHILYTEHGQNYEHGNHWQVGHVVALPTQIVKALDGLESAFLSPNPRLGSTWAAKWSHFLIVKSHREGKTIQSRFKIHSSEIRTRVGIGHAARPCRTAYTMHLGHIILHPEPY